MILTTIADRIATITLSRPERRNAMTPQMLSGLREAVESVVPVAGSVSAGSDVRAVVLAGAGRVFCAGFDLDLCRDHPDGSVMRELLSGLSAAVVALRACPVPVVVAAHGAAIAGGCALLGGADFVVADARAKLGYPVVKLGVSPAVNIPFVRVAMGDGPTRARTLDTELIDGREAHRTGLVSDLVGTPQEVLPAAHALAASLASKLPHGLLATRRWLDELSPVDAGGGLAVSLALTGGSEEHHLLSRVWSPRP